MAQIVKIDDTHVAKIGMQEVRRVYGATELAKRKEQLETDLAEVQELIDAMKAPMT